MQIIIRPILIDGLKKYSSLVHGISPRNFDSNAGEKVDLCLGHAGGAGVSPLHREAFLRSLGIAGDEMFLVKQVHGDRVYVLDDASLSDRDVVGIEADAIVTRLVGKPVGVMTADCIPVILYDALQHVVGVVHAGRKGTSENIVFKTIKVLCDVYGSRPENILMAIGPGIGGCCYEVDEACVLPFRSKFKRYFDFAKSIGRDKYMLDLFSANEEDGMNAGIRSENIFHSRECTACRLDRFFSYRKEGKTGRLVTLAMLRPRK